MSRGRPLARLEPIYFDQVAFDVARVRVGIQSVRELSRLVGISESMVSLIRNGWIPSEEQKVALAGVLKVNVNDVWIKLPAGSKRAAR